MVITNSSFRIQHIQKIWCGQNIQKMFSLYPIHMPKSVLEKPFELLEYKFQIK